MDTKDLSFDRSKRKLFNGTVCGVQNGLRAILRAKTPMHLKQGAFACFTNAFDHVALQPRVPQLHTTPQKKRWKHVTPVVKKSKPKCIAYTHGKNSHFDPQTARNGPVSKRHTPQRGTNRQETRKEGAEHAHHVKDKTYG